ncbi:hypothetical protein BGX34_001573 [Mortierella sp. NVP85]|nr:hypothetical protein BGX34_001573 [Mortierella sp. NVP85]
MSFPGQFKVEKHRREVHRIFQCKYKACQRRLRDQASLDDRLRERVTDHLGIVEDGSVSQALVKRQVDDIAEDTFCAICSCKLVLENSHLVIGTTIEASVRYYAYCRDCNNKRVALKNQNPKGKFRTWTASRLESFESRGTAIMTVAVQGYCCGQGEYTAREMLYLTEMSKAASPTCFWSGEELVITSSTDLVSPTHKFTADRVVFRDGEALPYGAEAQILVSQLHFANW